MLNHSHGLLGRMNRTEPLFVIINICPFHTTSQNVFYTKGLSLSIHSAHMCHQISASKAEV